MLERDFLVEYFDRVFRRAPNWYRQIMIRSATQEQEFLIREMVKKWPPAEVKLPPVPPPQKPTRSMRFVFGLKIYGWLIAVYRR